MMFLELGAMASSQKNKLNRDHVHVLYVNIEKVFN